MTYLRTGALALATASACFLPLPSRAVGNTTLAMTAQEREWVATLPVLRVGVDATAAPLSMHTRDGDAQGLALDYLHDALDAIGVRSVVVTEDDWATTVSEASAGRIDLLAAASPRHAGLARHFDFSRPYTEFPMMIVTRSDFVTIGGPDGLAGHRISANLSQGAVAAAVADMRGVDKLDVHSASEGLADVAEGRTDAYVGDIATAEYVIRSDFPARLKLAAATGERAGLAIAVSKRYAPLRPLLDRALANIDERRAATIRNTWLRSHYTWGGSWQEIAWKAGPIGLIMLSLILGMGYTCVRLPREIARRKRSEGQLADVTRHIPAVVYRFLYHADGRIEFTYVGGRPEPIFNVSADTILTDESRAFATIDPRDQAPLRQAVAEAAAGLSPLQAEMRIRDSVPERWVASHAVPRRVGHAVEFTGYWIDVSDRHAQAALLVEARRAAEAATVAKSQFLATMSHEIRTPMHGVIGMLEMLRLTPLASSQAQLLATAETSADALMQILDSVLDFSRIEAGHVEVEQAPVDCRVLVAHVVDLYRWQASEKNIVVTVHCDDRIPRYVMTDEGSLRQVLLNLFSNAVKFTSTGSIDVQLEVVEAPRGVDLLRITIEDTGIGIEEDDIDRLLMPFTQADTRTTRRFGGSGLGLAICQRLMTLIGGTLAMSRAATRGTRAVAALPLVAAPTAVARLSHPTPALPKATPSLTVIVAEDHEINRELVTAQLQKLGHRCHVACDGAEALALVLSEPADVLLTDVHMPVMDGIALACALRARGCGIRIIAMTANAIDTEKERCTAAGMSDFVTKPLRLDELRRALSGGTATRKTFAADDVREWKENFGDLSILPTMVARFVTATRADLARRATIRAPQEAADWVHRIVGGMRIFGPSPEAACAEALERDLRGPYGDLAMNRLAMFVAAAEQYLEMLQKVAALSVE